MLKSHSVKDALTGETKKTVYRYNGGKMLIREDTTVQHGTSPAVAVASMKYEWDAYGNLRSAEDALTGAETEYEYDPRYHLAVYTAERASSSPGSPAGWRYTINVLDDTGQKTTSSSQSMQEPAWEAKPSRTVPVGCRLVDIGDAWESWTTGPAGAAQLVIDWVRGPFQAVGYDVSYRRRGDSQWIRVASLGHGWLSPTSGRDTVPISFPEPGVYSIGVRMNSGILKGTYATIVSMTEQPYERAFPVPGSAKATVRYDYEDPGYPGNVTRRTVVQPGGQDEVTSFAYDPAGHAYPVSVSTRVTAANGTESTVVVRAEYDSFGRVTKYTTSAGGFSSTTAFDYDEIGRLTKATYPAVGGLASAKEWRWNDEARTVTRIDEEGRSLIEQYDQLGRFVELRRPAAPPNLTETAVTKVGYNSLGGVAYEEDAAGRRALYEYDGFGRRIKTVYPDGNFGTTSFEVCRSDPSGAVSVETVTDALGRYTKTYLDAAGRKVCVEQEAENGLSAVTRFEYDLLGRITRMVDPAGQETLYSYSTQTPSGTIYGYWDSPLEVDLPGGTEPVHKYMYDSCGRTVESDGAANAYDQLGRLKRATYPDGTYATFYYDKDGRMTEARLFDAGGEPVCKTGSQYDARGRKTAEWWDVRGARYSIGYGYNKAGDVVRMTFPDGASVEYLYDGWGRLIAIPGLFGTGAFDPGFAYAQSGALSWIGRANGIPTTIAEDGRGRVDRITHGHGGQPVLDLDYEYDSVGNVVRINGREYTYDRLGRLVGYQRPTQSGTVEWVGYNYDLVGNRISESAGGVVGRIYSYNTGNYLSRTIDQTGQIESAFTYGSSGEQLTRTNGGVATNYVYDAAQRLTEASRDGAVIAGAVYDALGRRIVYTDSSGTVLTLYSGNDIVYERADRPEAPTGPGGPGTGEPGDPGTPGDPGGPGTPGVPATKPIVIDDPKILDDPIEPDGGELVLPDGSVPEPPPGLVRVVTRYIVAHGKYLAKIVQEGASPAQTYFLHTDMLGSIGAVTDSAGQVVARFDYEPFGLLVEEPGPASAGGERYTGKPLDAELGLYYFGARYYDPGLGRFITADPAKQGLNWYAYCMANPMVLADPNGQQPILITQGWQGTAVHLAIERHLEQGLALVLPDVARVEPEITFKQLDLPDVRLDVRVTWKDALKEHYSIKQGTTWGENGRNWGKGVMELQDKYLPRDPGAVEGWRLLNTVWGWRVGVPALGPGAYVKYYCTTPGMIYYYADDGISLARAPVPAQDPAPAAAAMTMMALLRAILDAFSALSGLSIPVPVP